MKSIFVIVLLSLYGGTSLDKIFGKNTLNNLVNQVKSKRSQDINDLISVWRLYAIKSNRSETDFNVCPKVAFRKNGIGTISNSLGIENEVFSWGLKEDTLNIVYPDSIIKRTFTETKFTFKVVKSDFYFELNIQPIGKDYKYILRRAL